MHGVQGMTIENKEAKQAVDWEEIESYTVAKDDFYR